jgi:soluble lytic murein transglycosylase-like protein
MKTILLLVFLITPILCKAQSKKEIEKTIIQTAQIAGLDPDVALAVATVESGLNPRAVGALNEQGLFQLRPEYHPVVIGNYRHNVLVGVAYLTELHSKFYRKHGDAWFVMFNTGPYNPPRNPRKTAYYRKVVKELNRIKFERYLVKL